MTRVDEMKHRGQGRPHTRVPLQQRPPRVLDARLRLRVPQAGHVYQPERGQIPPRSVHGEEVKARGVARSGARRCQSLTNNNRKSISHKKNTAIQ